MREVYVISAKRTAIGAYLGTLSQIKAHELGSHLMKHIIRENNLPSNAIDEVIIGQVLQAGQGQNTARQAAMHAGINYTTPAITINKVCGSGLKAIAYAYDAIRLGADLILAGGQESMSQGLHGAIIRQNTRIGNVNFIDLMQQDGLIDAFGHYAMGITAENVAEKYNISRQEQDEFALYSQQKASAATKAGYFKNEILPISVNVKKNIIEFAEDEFVRHDATIDSLSKLKTAFKDAGTVTAGNSSGINDGASMFLLASVDAVNKYGLKPIAKISGHASAGVPPEIMGIGPVEAVKKLLSNLSITHDKLDLIEANEAFAAQAIAVNKLIGWDLAKVNISGGAIALGHPIGASGARIATTLIHNMQRLKAKSGLASLCIGGGMGIAMHFELID